MSNTKNEKSLLGHFKDYAKEHPGKTFLIGSAIVLGAATLVGGIIITGGLAAIPIVGGGIAAGAAAVHFGVLTGMSGSAMGLCIAGTASTSVGVAAAGVAATNQRRKAARKNLTSTAAIDQQIGVPDASKTQKRVRFADEIDNKPVPPPIPSRALKPKLQPRPEVDTMEMKERESLHR
ncbi:MAG: hypothetical protein EPO11_06735 [Gammaproteobacteria bacterium]|nr:MAG: hypothetical protein EPO11_06735 [Gammaproteobacteria bacterium]